MRRRSWIGGHSRVSRPSTRTTPDRGSSMRFTSFRIVLFPAPLRPTRTTTSPRSTESVKPPTREPPFAYWNPTSSNWTTGGAFMELVDRSATSVLREAVVGVAVQPALPRFGRRDDRVRSRVCVLRRVAIRGVVAAERRGALLTRAKVDPTPADLDALLAHALLRVLHGLDGRDVGTGLLWHRQRLSDIGRRSRPAPSQCARVAACS